MVMAPPTMHDSAVCPRFQCCPAFLHRHFPPQSPPKYPLATVNSSPYPGTAPQSLRIYVPVRGMYGCGKDCLILIPFRPPQISCFTLSLKCFSSDSDNCLAVRISTCFSSPPAEGRPSPANTPAFPSSSCILPSFVWVYIFFPTGQVLLSTLSWCSAGTSVSEGVFLMYP